MENKIKQIFNKNNIDVVNKIKKINIGFTNEIYEINKKYILKICNKIDNEKNFEKENYFLNLFYKKIPVPKVYLYDGSKKFLDKKYLILEKINGINLYKKWHLLTKKEREKVILMIIDIIKKINTEKFIDFEKKFNIRKISWKDKNKKEFNDIINKIEKNNIFHEIEINKIKKYINKNIDYLKEEKRALVYWDIHFDNILINDSDNISGIIDFEAVEILSIDYILDMIYKLQNDPFKFVSEEDEKNVIKGDYNDLVKIFKKNYKELFEFNNLDKRLELYSLKYDLNLLLKFPKEEELKKQIFNIIL